MPTTRSFGRRAPPRSASPSPAAKAQAETLVPAELQPILAVKGVAPEPQIDHEPAKPTLTVEQEIEEWNAARKTRRRSFREPWRTVSFAAGLGFVATSWMLPENVATIAEIALGILSIGSFAAGWRKPKPV